MKSILTGLAIIFYLFSHGQNLKDERAKIDAASAEIKNALDRFSKCLVTGNLETCISDFMREGTDPYKKFAIGTALYDISPESALKLCQEAYAVHPDEINFTRELAMCYHKNHNYKAAAPLYEKYFEAEPGDSRVNAWLADCYINTGDIAKASDMWAKVDFTKNHTGTDFAIHAVYGNDNEQLKKRNDYRKAVVKGDVNAAYRLIFLDLHWQKDWWNTIVQEIFLEEDLKLIQKLSSKHAKEVNFLKGYAALKQSGKKESKTGIKQFLENHNVILDGKPLVTHGIVQSDLFRMSLEDSIITAEGFYKQRGNEILNMAKKNNDIEMLNIYAHLQATVEGKVDPAIDKLGWHQFKDERFVVSYFIGKADSNRYDDPELAQALKDFPTSSNLQWVKVNCAYIEKKNFREELIRLIQKEFRSLKTDKSRSANSLNGYFFMLAGEK